MGSPTHDLMLLLERAILAFERDGDEGLAVELEHAGSARSEVERQIESLRAAGLLHPPERPARIGAWQIERRLGSGGMGTVFLGVMTQPLPRRAAIKVIRPGMDSHEVLARFAIEQQALALLEHPGIARIRDVGRTENGRPFLVMDYIDGQPIRTWCDQRNLPTAARIELFAKVCDAVQYAHQKGVLHRDLKPSNILVTERDGEPAPVVIDFGVAKSVGARFGLTVATLPGNLLGTPEYMSPEQAANEPDLDTRTDVYSLGVTLYELLTGQLPIDAMALRTRGVDQVLRDTEPLTPSSKITQLGERASSVAGQRAASVGSLARSLRGDLDWIVMKALARERHRRYGMPGELAADLRRHLANEPVSAGAPSPWYRWTKFCRRNRLQVAAGAAVVAALAIGLAASTRFYLDAKASEGTAKKSLDAAMVAIGELVQVGDSDLVHVPHLEEVRRGLLRRAVEFYRGFLATDAPGSGNVLERTLDALWRTAKMQSELGESDQALQHLDEFVRLLAGPASPSLPPTERRHRRALAEIEQARLLDRMGQGASARERLAPALVVLREMAGAGSNPDAMALASALAFAADLALDRDPNEALALIDEAIAIERRLARDPLSPAALVDRLRFGGDRANFLRLAGRRDEAIRELEALLELRREHPARDSWPATRATLRVLGVLDSCERPTDILTLANELQAAFERRVADHPAILDYRLALLSALTHRSNALLLQKNTAAALAVLARMQGECQAGLALVPNQPSLLRQLLIVCINVVTVREERRQLTGEWDEAAVDAALATAATTLAAIPEGPPRREARPLHMEVLRLRALAHELRGRPELAAADLAKGVAIAEELVAEAPELIEWKSRATELLRRQAMLLLAQGDWSQARAIVARTLDWSSQLRDRASAQGRWHTRHRELLLLGVRSLALAGDTEGALELLAQHQAMGAGGNGNAMDWIGKQEAARALSQLVAALPPGAKDRARFLAAGRDVLAEGLAFAQRHLDAGQSPTMVAVMRGNSLVIAHELEAAAGELAAAAARAAEAVDAFAVPFAESPSNRNEARLQKAVATWLLALQRAGDGPGLAAAATRANELFAGRAPALADLAAALAQAMPTTAIECLQAARRAGLPAAVLHEERFAALRNRPEFRALGAAADR